MHVYCICHKNVIINKQIYEVHYGTVAVSRDTVGPAQSAQAPATALTHAFCHLGHHTATHTSYTHVAHGEGVVPTRCVFLLTITP